MHCCLSLENLDLSNNQVSHIHFIGISGVSMKGLALFIKNHYRNIKVSGTTNIQEYTLSDIEINKNIDHLPTETTLIVYTSSLGVDHTDLLNSFQKKGYCIIHRSQLLNLLTKNQKRILVTGAHGKTSTTYFTYQLLKNQGYGCFIGVDLKETGTSYADGLYGYVIEGDESDHSFENIKPINYLLVNNISTDHLDNYNDSFEEYLYSFEKYCFHQEGIVIYNKNKFKQFESPISLEESSNAYLLDKMIQRTRVKNISYGVENSDVNIEIIEFTEKLQWRLLTQKQELLLLNNRIFTANHLFGQWNIYNITAALIVATLEGVIIEDHLNLIKPQRRMEQLYQDKNKIIFDDYAVHPTEIYNIITLCKEKYNIEEVAFIWEPHRPSRLRRLAPSFYEIFEEIQHNLFVLPIYNASEKNILSEEENIEYLNYKNKIYPDTLNRQLTDIINSSKYKIIVLFNAGSLSAKIREILKSYSPY